MNLIPDQLFRPSQYVEKYLVTAILDGTYPAGTPLPNERVLAAQIGVTRPMLRENLRRLAGEGWITIQHGKPTMVNDYWQQGGLSLLGTLSKYADYLPNGFITHLLEVRLTMQPAMARCAVCFQPKIILDFLDYARNLNDDAPTYSDYDRELQMLMAKNSHNPVFSFIFNDFSSVFANMALIYFSDKKARQASLKFYRELPGRLTRVPAPSKR